MSFRHTAAGCLLVVMVAPPSVAQNENPEAEFDRTVASAEASLRDGNIRLAESRYQAALLQGWMLIGIAAVGDGKPDDARRAFDHASASAADNHDAVAALRALRSHDADGARLLSTMARRIPAAQRARVADHIRETLPQIYLNIGIMDAQAGRFDRAAKSFEETLQIDPGFPQGQYSLGVAYFNDRQYDKAIPPLSRALEQQPANADARRMLALACLNTDQYARAADLLRDDPARGSNPSLQYAYGLALVKSDRAQEAQETFARLLAEHPDVPELNVVLGQAYAAQGNYDAAITSLRRAIDLKSDVADANAALGVIYLKQGRLDASADALRAELASHPQDVKARYTLATVLDLDGHTDEALKELGSIVADEPAYAEARYLLGKILLARGSPSDALPHLEMAARLSPDDPIVHYQLGLAYQRLGRADLAAREFETFQRLKDKRRGEFP